MTALVEVALPLPLPQTFTYRWNGGPVVVGTRVLVPFRRGKMIGWVAGARAEEEPARDGPGAVAARKLRDIDRVLEDSPSVPPELFRLCQWVADYYAAPLGQVLRAALPVALSSPRRPDPPVKRRLVLRLTRELPSLRQRDEAFGRAARQRECYELLETMGRAAAVADLTERHGFSESVLRGLVSRGLAELVKEEQDRDPFAGIEPASPVPLELTPAQSEAVRALIAAAGTTGTALAADTSVPGPAGAPRSLATPAAGAADRSPAAAAAAPGAPAQPFLLHGVTGSGKTQVYIELLREVVVRGGRGAIVLVPEIALTPQTVARFRSHFGDDVAVLHSGLSDGERFDAWRALRRGERRIAVGARSAIFAPVARLGAVVVDEEHEATYKQADAPRYHARDVAIVRAGLSGAVCVLGSATPCLESWHNARTGKFRLLELPERAAGRSLPPVTVVDLRPARGTSAGQSGDDGAGAAPDPGRRTEPQTRRARERRPILSETLIDAVQQRLDRREQSILLLNRRGYANFVQCQSCGSVWQCARCNVSLTFHRARNRLVCHYCFHDEAPPAQCDACGAHAISFRGVGTEQVERAVTEAFPLARVARMDVDTTTGKWAHHRILDRVERHEVDILLGTQMIAKGLDFPNVTLVGVVNADVSLSLPDFRASERTFQLLTQVAGRAGRGVKGGDVIIQTAMPRNYAIRAAVEHDYAAFMERELTERRGPGYPPHCRLANVVISGFAETAVQEAAEDVARRVRALLERGGDAVTLTGPAPCPIDRIRERWRWHFLLRSHSARRLGTVCQDLQLRYPLPPGTADLRLALDRDPVTLL